MQQEVIDGQAVYTDHLLKYDLVVLKISNPLIWRCRTSQLLALYQNYAGKKHLDVGVGTGYYLYHHHWLSDTQITLLDLNPHCLQHTQKLLNNKGITANTVQANVLEPLNIPEKTFDSIALMYLLHCLPGDLMEKAKVFDYCRPLLKENGCIFGATILADSKPHYFLSKQLQTFYNRKGIFHNTADYYHDLENILKQRFQKVILKHQGCVALFAVWL